MPTVHSLPWGRGGADTLAVSHCPGLTDLLCTGGVQGPLSFRGSLGLNGNKVIFDAAIRRGDLSGLLSPELHVFRVACGPSPRARLTRQQQRPAAISWLFVGDCRSPRCRMTYATATLDGNTGAIGSKSGHATYIVVQVAGHVGKAAKPLVSSWDRSCNRERVALLVKTISLISPCLVLCRLITSSSHSIVCGGGPISLLERHCHQVRRQ